MISTGAAESPSSGPGQPDVSYMAREQKLQQAQAAAVEAAREQGMRDGEARAQASVAARVEQERRAIAEAIAAFRGEAGAYFRRVETELVRLARGDCPQGAAPGGATRSPVAGRSGARRAGPDTGRIPGRAAGSPPGQADAWRALLAAIQREPSRRSRSSRMTTLEGICYRLEAASGSTEISLEGQLQEIESGFFDLLSRRSGDGHE